MARHDELSPSDSARCDGGSCCGGEVPRRQFLQVAGFGTAAMSYSSLRGTVVAGPFDRSEASDHFVPEDKKLDAAWVDALFAPGESTWYEGADLATIGMPIGGVCAGQLYLTGDGRLAHWDLFNHHVNTGFGRTSYDLGREPEMTLAQGFAIRIGRGDGQVTRTLDVDGFPNLRFCGEYPIGKVEYRDASLPLEISLEAFSPFVPLNEEDSGLPVTLLRFRLHNRSKELQTAQIGGWLENGVAWHSGQTTYGKRINRVRHGDGVTVVESSARPVDRQEPDRAPVVLADFEGADYGDWTVEGDAFGTGPAHGTLPGQQPVSGYQGEGLVNSFLGERDKRQGVLTSPSFTIDRPFLNLLVGGGAHKEKTCVDLIVDDEVVLTVSGSNREQLAWCNWNVRRWMGRAARIRIVDHHSEGWGHINVDQIELSDTPRAERSGPLADQYDFGTMLLGLLDASGETLATATVDGDVSSADSLFQALESSRGEKAREFGQPLVGAIGQTLELAPGETRELTFLVAWHFPRRPDHGNFYGTRFPSATVVAEYVARHAERLIGETHRWHHTWYDSTLPHWLLDRLFSTASTLATSTCQWWANGRFWAYEGVGCCRGTCTHVWNYEHTMARLFPRLERSVREMQDFNPQAGFVDETGMIRFRGENWERWAGDGQAGTVLKAYREHLVSADDSFLKANWPRIRKTLEFLIGEDANDDGILEGSQHNTYDIDFHGANTMIGSLYLGALRAAEAMATELGETQFAARCDELAQRGSRETVRRLFTGEYFIQDVDLQEHPKSQVAGGCLADQLFGQGWAHQVGLGYLYPRDVVRKTLQSIWRFNWTPDVGPQNEAHRPERWFARPGEAGLFTCTWPYGEYLEEGVRYKNEVWTGIEYQVAGHLAAEGMLTEALAICRAIHERYHPSAHNPWNEVECGDHYARGMASYGVFLSLCGFEYHGPQGELGFAPRLRPEDFRAAFTAAEGWGTLSQVRRGAGQVNRIELGYGRLCLSTLRLEVDDSVEVSHVEARQGDEPLDVRFTQQGRRVTISLPDATVLTAPAALQVELS